MANHDKPAILAGIPAIVLCFDRDIELALLAMESYCRLAPDLPVRFHLPYNSNATVRAIHDRVSDRGVCLVRSPRDLVPTIRTLLNASPPSKWIYWCVADRYPISMADSEAVGRLFNAAASGAFDGYDSVKLTHWRELEACNPGRTLRYEQFNFFEIPSSLASGFWHHQLMKRDFIEALVKDAEDEVSLSAFHSHITHTLGRMTGTTLLPCRNIIKFDESSAASRITLNAYVLLRKRGRLEPNADAVTMRAIGFHSPRIRKSNRFWLRDGQTTPETLVSRRPPEMPRYLVYTYGGVGSKMLVKWLYHGDSNNDLRQAHCHWRIPPISVAPHQSVIYAFGDPRATVLSFFQRRFSRHARHDFRESRRGEEPKHDICLRAQRNIEAAKEQLDASWDLERYLSQDLDLFRLEEHFDYWRYADRDYPIHFIKYETIWDNIQTIAGTFGRDATLFPAAVERRARLQHQRPWVIYRLNFLYGDFADRLASLPDVFCVEKGRLTEMAPTDGAYRYWV